MMDRDTKELEALPPLLTTREVADLLRVTTSAATTARHRGQAPFSYGFRSGRKLLYRRADVLAWLEKQGR